MVKEKTGLSTVFIMYTLRLGVVMFCQNNVSVLDLLDFAGPKWKLQFKQFEAINYMLASSCFLFRCQCARMIMGQMTSLYLTWHFCFVHTISQSSLPIKQKWLGQRQSHPAHSQVWNYFHSGCPVIVFVAWSFYKCDWYASHFGLIFSTFIWQHLPLCFQLCLFVHNAWRL